MKLSTNLDELRAKRIDDTFREEVTQKGKSVEDAE